MTTKQQAAMQQALDALEHHTAIKHPQQRCYRDDAIEALREALAEPGQEWVNAAMNAIFKMFHYGEEVESDDGMAMQVPLDIWNDAFEAFDSLPDFAPPQRKPLASHKDRPDQNATFVKGYGYVHTAAVRAVEAAHGITGENT